MTRALRRRAHLAAMMCAIALLHLAACGGGGGDGGRNGDGGTDQVAYNLNEANMTYAAGVASRVVDSFPPLSDLLSAAFLALSQPGAVQSGQAKPIVACAAGGASLAWTDTNGDGAWSGGDAAAVALTSCRVHPGDGETLSGSITLTFSSVTAGRPRTVVAPAVLDLVIDGGSGTLRGALAVAATEVSYPDAVFYSAIFRPTGTSMLTAGGSTSFELACFQVQHDYNPAPGFHRWVALTGSLRVLGKVTSFSPGSRLRYRADDQPGGSDKVTLLSFMDQESCPALGISGGVGGSDGSTLDVAPGLTPGEMRLDLYRAGTLVTSSAATWWDLLHPNLPPMGIINGSNAVQVASIAVTSLGLPRDVGALATDLVVASFRGLPVQLCTSGSYSVAPRPAFAVGESVTITFASCVTDLLGGRITLDGSALLNVTGVGGNPATDTYALASRIGPLQVTTSEPLGTAQVTGSFLFSRTAAGDDVTERSEAIPGAALTISEAAGGAATERRSTAFSVTSAATAAGAFTFATAGDELTVDSGIVAGNLAVTVTSTVQGAGQNPPDAGAVRIVASDGTSLTLSVAAGGAVSLGLDGDGNGTVDSTISSAWTELR